MSEMRWVALMAIVLAAVVAAAGEVARAAPPAGGAGSPTRAVVTVATPTLPAGRSAAARARWHELRAQSSDILGRVAARDDLDVVTAIPEIGQLSVRLGPGGLPALRRRLAGDPRVESVQPDVPVRLRFSPNDYAFANPDPNAPNDDLGQWNLIHEGGPRAWDLSRGTGAEVAVVDSGADGTHPDLAHRIVAAQSFGTSTSPTTDTFGHGTHTAGLACGDSNNGYGIASLGFQCSLFIAKIDVNGPCSNVSAAVTAAADRNSDVISMSLGGCDSSLVPALSYAQSRDAVLVVAADNVPNPDGACGGLFDPHDCIYPEEWVQPLGTGPQSGFDRGLVVTAAKYDGSRASFAEETTRVSVAAFGAASDTVGGQQGILSTWPANTTDLDTGVFGQFGPCGCRTTVNGDSRFAYLQGTSMATPQVAGEAALIRSVKPNMANTKVVDLIKATASHCGSYGDGIGWGVIRADQAVAAALDRDIAPPTSRVRSAKRARPGRRGRIIVLRIKRTDTSGGGSCVKLPTAGVKKVILFASANRGPFHRIGKTRKAVFRFHAKRGRRYRFYSIAVDKDGNREAPPAAPQAKAKA